MATQSTSSPGARPKGKAPRGPLILVGVAAVGVVYFLYSRKKAAAAAAAAAAANPAGTAAANGVLTPTPAGTYDPNAGTGALLSYLTGLSGAGSAPPPPPPLPQRSPPPGTAFPPPAAPSWTQVQGNGDAGSQLLDVVGSIVSPSTYQGYNVGGGAPVYANIGGVWRIGVPAAQIPVGTALATPVANQSQIAQGAGTVTEPL